VATADDVLDLVYLVLVGFLVSGLAAATNFRELARTLFLKLGLALSVIHGHVVQLVVNYFDGSCAVAVVLFFIFSAGFESWVNYLSAVLGYLGWLDD